MGVFNVNVHYDVCFSYNIEAENEDEARRIAEGMSESADTCEAEWDFTETNSYEYDEDEAESVEVDN